MPYARLYSIQLLAMQWLWFSCTHSGCGEAAALAGSYQHSIGFYLKCLSLYCAKKWDFITHTGKNHFRFILFHSTALHAHANNRYNLDFTDSFTTQMFTNISTKLIMNGQHLVGSFLFTPTPLNTYFLT